MFSRCSLFLFLVGVMGCGEESKPASVVAEADAAPKAPHAIQILAGVGRVEITDKQAIPVNDPLYAKALVIKQADKTAVLITVDAVAIGGIGYIRNDYLGKVRAALQKDLQIPPESVVVNASHCHGIVCKDVAEKTVEAVKIAAKNLVPVSVGVGLGSENRVSENRRLMLKNGKEADVRHAYSLPPDSEVVGVGPIDPQIGILKLDKADGKTLAVVYNFACHPIMGVPSGGNTADLTGFASKVVEDNLGEGSLALFVQGCGGDINPVLYKDVSLPRSAEPLGNMLGLSVLDAVRKIKTNSGGELKIINEKIQLPRADNTERIDRLLAEQNQLLKSLQGTSLNLKTFMELTMKYQLAGEFPSADSHHYLSDKLKGRNDFDKLDELNRKHMKQYLDNIMVMEKLTRVQTNLSLLRKHQETNLAAGRKPLEVEMAGVRVGDFVLVTFPGELTVEIGLNVKKNSPHRNTFVAGYTNGYIFYSPTAKQLQNVGGAQEDSDCLLAPEWEKIFYTKVAEMLKKL